ncbi:hypothetical protein PUR57_11980 [Streptomyces sp. JV176]|uniref:hypothetical protein n=1 Tax=Streptomyces sp. JV176 TaxID=858630 RepID=UPI002E766287|nr:hypothetical protein [Streptomyces sp. JV176]MEE1799383.1 hypothetical protein [Streptomyces sp. JV176]
MTSVECAGVRRRFKIRFGFPEIDESFRQPLGFFAHGQSTPVTNDRSASWPDPILKAKAKTGERQSLDGYVCGVGLNGDGAKNAPSVDDADHRPTR